MLQGQASSPVATLGGPQEPRAEQVSRPRSCKPATCQAQSAAAVQSAPGLHLALRDYIVTALMPGDGLRMRC